jgi:glucose/mannose-6-phosphate isomerase
MKKLVAAFAQQLEEAIKIGKNYSFVSPAGTYAHVVISGLGGSGIGASIVQNYVYDKMSVPLIVNKEYTLPAFVGKQSLVVICSYSGNTEETLAAMQDAIKAKATIVCITSGGKIAEIAQQKGYDCIIVPGGMPPRSCLGYSLVQILYTLKHFGVLDAKFEKELLASVKLLNTTEEDVQSEAKAVAKKLKGKLPIVYSASSIEGVAIRFRQQINENSKLLSWHGAIPEMNHNELVGWRDDAKDKAVVILRNEDDYERIKTRIEINKKVFKKYKSTIIEINSKGKTYFEKAFYLIHLTDWVSVYLADMRKVDATEVKVIDFLKSSLAKS